MPTSSITGCTLATHNLRIFDLFQITSVLVSKKYYIEVFFE